jgi:hypothetical protein
MRKERQKQSRNSTARIWTAEKLSSTKPGPDRKEATGQAEAAFPAAETLEAETEAVSEADPDGVVVDIGKK